MGRKRNFQWQDAALPIFAAVSVLALLFRLPVGLMDMALSINLAISATIFLATFFISKPLEFSAFPTILLTTTLYRLVLNVSTTRLILTQGNAGQVVDAFSRFVAGDRPHFAYLLPPGGAGTYDILTEAENLIDDMRKELLSTADTGES